jgi:curved DNA-binding protein CbpA
MARRDPHAILGLTEGASQATIKAAWRRLAREHHPDLAANAAQRRVATRRMAEINAAYADLRKGGRPSVHAAHRGAAAEPQRGPAPTGDAEPARPAGPPPPPATRPVTARFDTSDLFHPRNATTTPRGDGYRHHPRVARPPVRAYPRAAEPPRASDPTGPLERLRRRRERRRPLPSLDGAREMVVPFGKFHGRTLGEIAAVEPAYVSWLSRAITRDPDLLDAARVVAAAAPAARGEAS